MRLKSNIKLRKMGDKYMLVNLSNETVNLANVLTLNETAASIWREFQNKEFEASDIAQWLLQNYEVTAEQAQNDVKALIEAWTKGAVVE